MVEVLDMVSYHPDFKEHSRVINGYSDLMAEIFDDKGKHARSVLGMNSLPFGIAVEVEVIGEVVD